MSGRTCERWLPGRPEVYRTPKAVQFVSADDFLALAVKTYMAAARAMVPPNGEPWADEGATWANPEDFYRELVEGMGERLRRVALASGDLREVPWEDEDAFPADLTDEVVAGAGRSPAAMAHGCAASASSGRTRAKELATGADATPVAGGVAATPADRAFSCLPGQKLPSGGAIHHAQSQEGGHSHGYETSHNAYYVIR